MFTLHPFLLTPRTWSILVDLLVWSPVIWTYTTCVILAVSLSHVEGHLVGSMRGIHGSAPQTWQFLAPKKRQGHRFCAYRDSIFVPSVSSLCRVFQVFGRCRCYNAFASALATSRTTPLLNFALGHGTLDMLPLQRGQLGMVKPCS